MNTLYLIDGFAQFFRAYHAIRTPMTSPVTGEPTNMTYGFIGMLIKLLKNAGAHLADELENIVALHDPSNVAAVIIEPIAGSAGVILPPQGYLERVREICDRHGILLIFDEVICGFGRTGDSFGASRFGVTPDLCATGKAISGGLPLGVLCGREDIMRLANPRRRLQMLP